MVRDPEQVRASIAKLRAKNNPQAVFDKLQTTLPPVKTDTSDLSALLAETGIALTDVIPPKAAITDRDALIAAARGYPIMDAYRDYCPQKYKPPYRDDGKGNIQVRCPNPAHEDVRPDCSLNTNKNTGICYSANCSAKKIDAIDIVAWGMGLSAPNPSASDFEKVIYEIGNKIGWIFQPKLVSGGTEAIAPEQQEITALQLVPPVLEIVTEGPVSSISDNLLLPSLDINNILPNSNTFLDIYCTAAVGDQSPPEYHLACGLIAVGLSVGRKVRLFSWGRPPAFANTYSIMVGSSTTGKSGPISHLINLLEAALPDDYSNKISMGLGVTVKTPSSLERLVFHFDKDMYDDPSNPKLITGNHHVKGLIHYSELSRLTGYQSRTGNPMADLIQELYDMKLNKIETDSMTSSRAARDYFACFATTTQDDSVKNLITESANSAGFWNRFGFICANEVDALEQDGVPVDLSGATAPLINILGWAAHFKANELITYETGAAEKLILEYLNYRIKPLTKAKQNVLFNRLSLSIKKTMLLLACNERIDFITEDIINRGILYTEYLIKGYEFVSSQIGTTVNSRIQTRILEIIKKLDRGQGVTFGVIFNRLGSLTKDRGIALHARDNLLLTKEIIAIDVQVIGKAKEGRFRLAT